MVNEITKQEVNFYERYGDLASARSITGKLLKFSKFGEYRAGVDNEEIPIGTELIAYMPSFAAGYVRWENGSPAEAQMGYVGEGFIPPKRNDLGWNDSSEWSKDDRGVPRDPWQFTNSLIFIDFSKEALFTYNASSKGGLGALGGLSKIYGRHIKTHPRELPTVKLGVDSYPHKVKAYGEIRFPVFSIVGDRWVSVDDIPPLEGLPPFVETRQLETTMKQDMGEDGEIPF